MKLSLMSNEYSLVKQLEISKIKNEPVSFLGGRND